MPNQEKITCGKYKLEKARDSLNAAKLLLDGEVYTDSVNCAYYAIFHSMNVLLALRGIGFKKHSCAFVNFNSDYIKTGLIGLEYAKMAKEAFSVKIQSDYSDFYCISKQEAIEQYDNAVKFVNRIEVYVKNQI